MAKAKKNGGLVPPESHNLLPAAANFTAATAA
jgi:hypothetical protein